MNTEKRRALQWEDATMYAVQVCINMNDECPDDTNKMATVYRIKPEELYILSCEKGRGRLRM